MLRISRLALFVATVVVAGACGNGTVDRDRVSSPSDGDADATVVVADMAFEPATVTVPAGGTVAWVWDDAPVEHDVAFDDGPASQVQGDGTWEHGFDAPGTYEYVCTLHPSMKATVIVE